MTTEFEKLHALVIEDKRHMRRRLCDLLALYGMTHVLQATNGVDAMDMLLGCSVDFVLSDLSMHPMDGMEFTQRVRQSGLHFANVPIIIISGHSERSRVRAARDAGATEFIVWPAPGLSDTRLS